MPAKRKLKVTPSSGNVFRDLGFSERGGRAPRDPRGPPDPDSEGRDGATPEASAAREAAAGEPAARQRSPARAPASLQHRDADRHARPARGAGAARGQADPPAPSRLAPMGRPALREVEHSKCAHQSAHHSRITARFAETFSDFWRQTDGTPNQKHSMNTGRNVRFQEFPRSSCGG